MSESVERDIPPKEGAVPAQAPVPGPEQAEQPLHDASNVKGDRTVLADGRPVYLPTQTMIMCKDGRFDWQVPVISPCDLPVKVDEYTDRVLSARSYTATLGECPECGARLPRPTRRQRRAAKGRPIVVSVEHADDCPAGDSSIPDLAELARLGVL